VPDRNREDGRRGVVKGVIRDIQALEVHGDFLTRRVQLATDATLGMINLVQSATVRIVSVVAVLFSPPTLIASVDGMNFPGMPELNQPWGSPRDPRPDGGIGRRHLSVLQMAPLALKRIPKSVTWFVDKMRVRTNSNSGLLIERRGGQGQPGAGGASKARRDLVMHL